MMELLIGLLLSCLSKVPELLSLGLPDRRLCSIWPRFALVVDDQRQLRSKTDLRQLDQLLEHMDRRVADLESCGVPDTLVHGDFHPGNVRGAAGRHVILDWGDSAVGHPVNDELAGARPLTDEDRRRVAPAWSAGWRRVPLRRFPPRQAEFHLSTLPAIVDRWQLRPNR